jgi:hypothetical protein
VIGIDGRLYLAHVIAFVIVTGTWPVGVVDHRNGDGTDNRWTNLRDVSHAVNVQNVRKARATSQSGMLGVARHRNGRYRATIVVGGKQRHLGYFDTPEQAHAAYVTAKRELHPGCTL